MNWIVLALHTDRQDNLVFNDIFKAFSLGVDKSVNTKTPAMRGLFWYVSTVHIGAFFLGQLMYALGGLHGLKYASGLAERSAAFTPAVSTAAARWSTMLLASDSVAASSDR